MPKFSKTFDSKAFFLTIALSFLFIYLFVLSQLGKAFDFVDKKISARKAFSQMKAGDLVVVSYNSLRGKLVKVFTGSAWVHSGLVLEEGGKKYIVEVAYYNEDQYGVLMMPLNKWFDFNENRVLGWRVYNGKYFPNGHALQIVKRDMNRDIEPDMNAVSWLRTMYKSKHNDEGYGSRDEYFCSEYIMHVLQTIGVIEGYGCGYKPCGYKPWELFYGKLPLNKPHKYGKSYMIHG